MKTSIILKVFLVLPIILFIDYILMIIIGFLSWFLGFGENFYCGSYCIFGKIILTVSAIFFGIIIFPDMIELFKSEKKIITSEH